VVRRVSRPRSRPRVARCGRRRRRGESAAGRAKVKVSQAYVTRNRRSCQSRRSVGTPGRGLRPLRPDTQLLPRAYCCSLRRPFSHCRSFCHGCRAPRHGIRRSGCAAGHLFLAVEQHAAAPPQRALTPQSVLSRPGSLISDIASTVPLLRHPVRVIGHSVLVIASAFLRQTTPQAVRGRVFSRPESLPSLPDALISSQPLLFCCHPTRSSDRRPCFGVSFRFFRRRRLGRAEGRQRFAFRLHVLAAGSMLRRS
jgi:hypothetical protein